MAEESSLELKLRLLERDVQKLTDSNQRDINQLSSLMQNLSKTIERIVDISSSVKEVVAVHELKITQLEKNLDKILDNIDKKRLEDIARDNKLIEVINGVKKDLEEQIDSYKSDQAVLKSKMDSFDKLKWKIGAIGTIFTFVLSTAVGFFSNYLSALWTK